MAGPSWLVDGNRIATKIKSVCHPERVIWESNPSKACPNCQHVIDNSDVTHQWPGLPRGVKFDPTDQEIIWHLLAKVGKVDAKPHPFIEEFIPTVYNEDGICYTHPQNLPGVKQDGSPSHFFHRAIKAYNTGTRKRRKIQGDNSGDVRWHKTGRTKPVMLDGVHVGKKKIMVLYMSLSRGKAEKTNWVMHQYHLGTNEDEQEGEYVISKVSLQQQQPSKGEKTDEGLTEIMNIIKVDPMTPNSVTPELHRAERRNEAIVSGKEIAIHSIVAYPDPELPQLDYLEDYVGLESVTIISDEQPSTETNQVTVDSHHDVEDDNWWGGSQILLDSQQIVEGLSICDELLQSQSPARDEDGNEKRNGKPRLSDYAKLGPEYLKKDLEECQNLDLDLANVETDTPPEFRLSQLEFGSQDSFFAWGGGR